MTSPEAPLYLEIAETVRRRILAGELPPGARLPPVRVMAGQWGCTAGTVNRAYRLLAREGFVSAKRGAGTRVCDPLIDSGSYARHYAALVNRSERYLLEAFGAGYTGDQVQAAFSDALRRARQSNLIPEADTQVPGAEKACALRFVGSHDLLIERLRQLAQDDIAGCHFSAEYAGSLGGLIALARQEADFAGVHLWDEGTDSYNLPYVERVLPNQQVVLYTLAHRELGLVLSPGSGVSVRTLADLANPAVRFVNRQRGSGTRVWLEACLRRQGVPFEAIPGFERELNSHHGVARAVAEGSANVGLALRAAADRFGLTFLPLTRERYELVFPAQVWERHESQSLIGLVESAPFWTSPDRLAGYDTTETGRTRMVPP